MSESAPETVFILPPNERFQPGYAGAISLVVQRLAAAMLKAAVLGAPCTAPYPGIEYVSAQGLGGMISALRRRRPTNIIVQQQPRLALALALFCPWAKIVLVLHNDPLTMRGLKRGFERQVARRRLYRIVCVSAFLQSRFMRGMSGAPPSVIPNLLTLHDLPSAALERRREILFAGRIVQDKAPDVFIEACALALPHLPGWQARVIGGDRFGPDSPRTEFVAEMQAKAGAVGIIFEGAKPHQDVLAAMAQAAIAVVPSRWAEPFGLTALEAMASGAALITTGAGGLREVAGEAALYVPVDDAAALAMAIRHLATRDEDRAALSALGRERAAMFDTPRIVARWHALLNGARALNDGKA